MRWFGASMLYEQSFDDGTPPLLEERVFLLQADGEVTARAAATNIGNDNSLSYRNRLDESVDWHFVTVIDVKELFDDPIGHGTEVFYRFLTKHEADMLLRAVDSPIDDDTPRTPG